MNNHKRADFTTVGDFEKKWGVTLTKAHNGKMKGFQSLSTSPLANPLCVARSQSEGLICSKCYSFAMNKCYKELKNMLIRNTEVLAKTLIPVNEWPIVNALAFRLESFGDVSTEVQVMNYFNFCKRNPRVTFSAWTKNAHIYKKVIEAGYKKPKNLVLIVSSPVINEQTEIPPFADKVFTVYDKKYAEENNIAINCGANKCLACMRCYRKGGETIINELLK